MNTLQNQKHIGFLFKKSNLFNISMKDFILELEKLLFELAIMKEAVQHLQANDLSAFDSTVGDWKCQTRTSMIVDLLESKIFSDQEQSKALEQINLHIISIQKLYNEINNYNTIQLREFIKKLHSISAYHYLENLQVLYEPSPELTLLSLCFFITLKNHQLPIFTTSTLSTNKMNRCINDVKKQVCYLSIKHEQDLIKQYGTAEEQKSLEQIEIKTLQQMTSTFISFVGIYKKMLTKKQAYIIHTLYFCACGGVQKIGIEPYISVHNKFIKSLEPLDPNQPISVLEAYQYPGSLAQLQGLVGAINEEYIPEKYLRSCTCANPTLTKNLESFDLAAFANFAQHPQFTSGASIDWQGLGLADSDLKKEYDYLLTLNGFSIQDMSNFFINHLYPSTVEQALKPIEIPHRIPENMVKHPHHLPTYLHCFHSDTGGKTMIQCNC